MATLEQLSAALVKADAAGDAVAAKAFADEIRRMRSAAKPARQPDAMDASLAQGPTEGNSFLQNAAIGVGKTFTDVGLGVRQLGASVADAIAPRGQNLSSLITGQDNSRGAALNREAAEKRSLDAPVGATGGGKVGQVVGGVATAVPAMFVPGANSVVGASLIGGALGAVQPAESGAERAANIGLGGALGGVGQKVGGFVAQKIGEKIAERTAAGAADKINNSVRDATLQQARDLGFVVPPSAGAKVGFGARQLENLAGKEATEQAASVHNQQLVNKLVREDLGIADHLPLNRATLGKVRAEAGKVYKDIKAAGVIKADAQFLDDVKALRAPLTEVTKDFPKANIGAAKEIRALASSLARPKFDASSALEYTKQLRKSATGNLSGASAADPAKRALGMAQRDAAGALEDQILRHLEASGKADVAAAFDKARTLIAKTYSVEGALNEGTGNVAARGLGKLLKRGKPLSGNIEKIAKFAEAFPQSANEVRRGSSSALEGVVTATGAVTHPELLAYPVGRAIAKGTVLSKPYQNAMLNPNYAPNNALLKMLQQSGANGRLAAPLGLQFIDPEQQ